MKQLVEFFLSGKGNYIERASTHDGYFHPCSRVKFEITDSRFQKSTEVGRIDKKNIKSSLW